MSSDTAALILRIFISCCIVSGGKGSWNFDGIDGGTKGHYGNMPSQKILYHILGFSVSVAMGSAAPV